MKQLVVTMSGRPSISWQGKLIGFPFCKMEAMLYYLLVQGKATREELAGLLWSDMDDGTAKKNLRNTLYMLKKLLGAELIVTIGRSFVAINQDFVETVDVHTFNQDGERSLAAYRGVFLEGFSCREAALFEEWVAGQREKYQESYTSKLTKHIVELMNAKQYSDAKHSLQQLIKADEYNESAYRALMRIYERERAYNKVIQTYSLLEKKFASELSIIPNDKTREIYERVQTRSVKSPVREVSMGDEIFFGREKELSQLGQNWEHFRSGKSSKTFIMLHGEQGVGKSALLLRFLEAQLPQTELVLKTQCYEPEVNYPFKAWSTVFAQVLKVLAQDEAVIPVVWRQIIAYIFPNAVQTDDWQELNTYYDGNFIQPGVIEEVLCGLFVKLGKKRPIILVIEDVHWMDMQGLSALKSFFRLYASQVFCVATCRSEHVPRLESVFANVTDKAAETWLEVEAFAREDVIRFSSLVLPPDKIRPEILEKLVEYTDGNALFLTECIKLIQLGQNVERLSPKLQSVLNARIRQLSPNNLKVLEVVSAFIRDATYDTIVNVCGLNELELVEAVDEILHKRLLIEIQSPDGRDLSYKFTHIMIRDYIYSKMSSLRQTIIHQRIAVYLEQKMSSDRKARDLYSEVLHHYAKARQKLKVLEYSTKLAERFSSPHYEMYPLNDDAQPGGGSNITDRLQITNYLQEIGNLLASLPQEMIGEEPISRYKAAYLEMLGRYRIWRGEHFAGLKVIHELLRLAASKEYTDYLIKGYQQVAYCGIETGRHKLVAAFAGKLLNTATELSLKEKMATALRLRGYARAMQGDFDLAEQDYRQSIKLFKLLSDQGKYANSLGAAYSYIGDLRRSKGDFAEALQYYEKAINLYNDNNISEALSIICINAGAMSFELGEYEIANKHFAKALRISEQFGGQMGFWCCRSHAILHCITALIAVRHGNAVKALADLKQAKDFFETHSDGIVAGFILRVKTEIAAKMASDSHTAKVFVAYLPLTVEDYHRQYKAVLGKHSSIYQMQRLKNRASLQ